MVGIRKDTVTSQQNTLCRGAVDPMKNTAPSEMAADLMQGHTSGELPSSAPKFDDGITAAQPLSVSFRHQHRGVSESTGPFHLNAEHVRMAGRIANTGPRASTRAPASSSRYPMGSQMIDPAGVVSNCIVWPIPTDGSVAIPINPGSLSVQVRR